jgi:carbamoyltransferase
MGLAPYGEPRYAQLILDRLLDLKADGSFRMNLDYFDYCAGLRMTGRGFEELFGGPRRQAEGPLTQREMDLARSIQDVTEEIVLRTARHVRSESGERNLCLAGGVALNCVANGRVLRSGLFDGVWIQPAAGDAGGALGAAYVACHHHLGAPVLRKAGRDLQQASCLGPQYDAASVAAFLASRSIPAQRLDEAALLDRVARLLAGGQVVGWFDGRMEYGPRALGRRSILGDPRSPSMQKRMNLKIKFRESFRPFAPAVLAERAQEWFDLDVESQYMLLTAQVRRLLPAGDEAKGLARLEVPRSEIPAVTHVDGSARVQTVRRDDHPLFHALLARFAEFTGCAVLVNTSFNVRGEPIVESPLDAWRCFMRTDIDALAMGGHLLLKGDQPPWTERGPADELD